MKAVVFVDVQNDFIDGALRNEQAIKVAPKIVEFAKKCAADDSCKLYATRDTHEKTTYKPDPNAAKDSEPLQYDAGYLTTLEGQKLPVEHCIEGSDGWQVKSDLKDVLLGKCTFVNKPTFGSYDLVDILNEDFNETYQYVESLHCNIKCLPKVNGTLDEIVICGFCTSICGFCTSICVLANAVLLRAKFPNTKITVMKDLCACVTDKSREAALEVLKMQQIEVI